MSSPLQPSAPAGQISPDGYWWWNGTAWVPTQAQYQTAPSVAAGPRRPVPWLRISAGAMAVVGVIATLIGCILPYATFSDSSGGPTTTSSIFNGGFAGSGWNVPEPVFVMLAGAAAATVVFIGLGRVAQGIAAGILIGVGLQATFMWVSYFGAGATNGSPEAGGVIGVIGALFMFVAGLLVLAALVTQAPPDGAEAAALPVPPAA